MICGTFDTTCSDFGGEMYEFGSRIANGQKNSRLGQFDCSIKDNENSVYFTHT